MGLAARAASPPDAARLREQASGIDALYLSGHGEVSPALLRDLEVAKQQARDAEEPLPFDLGGLTVQVEGRGLNKYPYRLVTPHGHVGVTDSARLPPLHMQPLAEHIHAVGPRTSVAWFADLASSFTRGLRLTASRVDVFSDWQGLELGAEDRLRFVGRSTRKATREEGESWSGFEFGRRTAGTVTARLYDKTREIKAKPGSYWPELWKERGDRYAPDQSVARVEFEFQRRALRQHGVETAVQAIDLAPALWVTATTDWLTLRVPTADQTRSRWPLDPVWQRIQRPSFAEHVAGVERLRDARGEATLLAIRPGLIGYLSSFAALTGVESVEGLTAGLIAYSRDYEVVSGVTFTDRVRDKRRKLRLA